MQNIFFFAFWVSSGSMDSHLILSQVTFYIHYVHPLWFQCNNQSWSMKFMINYKINENNCSMAAVSSNPITIQWLKFYTFAMEIVQARMTFRHYGNTVKFRNATSLPRGTVCAFVNECLDDRLHICQITWMSLRNTFGNMRRNRILLDTATAITGLPNDLTDDGRSALGPGCINFCWWCNCCYRVITQEARHDDVIKWKHFPRYWPFVRGIHRSPVNSSHKGQWRGALMFSLICVWIYG